MFPCCAFWRWSVVNSSVACLSRLKLSAYFPLQSHRLGYDRWVLFRFFCCNSSQTCWTAAWKGLTVIHSDVYCPPLRWDVSLSLVTTKKKWQITGFRQRTYQSVGFLGSGSCNPSTWGMPRHITGWHCFHFLLSWTPSAGSTGFVLSRLRALEKAGVLREPRASQNSVPSRQA